MNDNDFLIKLTFWKDNLADIGEYVKFPNLSSSNFAIKEIPYKSFDDFFNQQGITNFEFMAAIFSLYLSRIDMTKGCLLKTVIRDNDEDRNTLLTIEYKKEISFMDYVEEVKDAYADALKHTIVDIENYIEDSLSYYSIYDFTASEDISLDDEEHDFSKFNNLSILNCESSALTLNIYKDSLELAYDSNLFSEVYIEHMAANIGALINEAIDDPNQLISEMNMLSDNEKSLISQFSKGESIDIGEKKSFASLFRESYIKYPDYIAVDDGVNQVTYGDLERFSNSITYDLENAYDIDINNPVGLMIPRNYHYPELVLALNKLGAAFIPIDPIYPINRIDHMLNIANSDYIITTREFADLHDFTVDVICIEDLKRDLDGDFEIIVNPNDIFAVFFTSGTTGLPKGVTVTNYLIQGMGTRIGNVFKPSSGDVVGILTSFSFMISARMFIAFSFGETVRIFNENEQRDPVLLIKTLKEQEMNDMGLPQSLGLHIFANEDIKLKYMAFDGAKVGKVPKKSSDTKLACAYGTTEYLMALMNIFNPMDADDYPDGIPLGKPVANTWVYILDEKGNQVPIGVPGEICISSDFLSPGYYNQPDLSNVVFVDNPISDCDDNKRMYRTGDIGFYNFEGEVEII